MDEKEYFTKEGLEIVGWYGKGKPIVADSRISKIFRNSDCELYSDKQKMKQKLDDFVAGKKQEYFTVAEKLPPVLAENDFDDTLELAITNNKLANLMLPEGEKGQSINTHNLSINDIKEMYTAINFPKYILKNQKEPGLIIVTKLKDYKQRPIIVVIKKDGHVRKENEWKRTHIITSVYGRNNFNGWIDKQEILWNE